jgi:hypothetical protein
MFFARVNRPVTHGYRLARLHAPSEHGFQRRQEIGYSKPCAMVVEEAQPSICTERTTMIIIGIVLSFVGLAVHALPFFAGVTVGLAAYHSGSGPFAAIITGAIAGGIILALGQVTFTRLRSPVMRAALALLFVVPAAVAGYYAAHGLAQLVVPAEAWRDAIAIAGATIVAATAFTRMWLSPPPDAGANVAAGLTSPRLPASQSGEA